MASKGSWESDMQFNLNNNVTIRLTERGRILVEKHDLLLEPDEDGYVTAQLWVVMQYLGEYCQIGSNLPFETEIELINGN